MCRQMSGHGRTYYLLSPIRIIVQMLEPDCFLRYRMCCNAEFYYVGENPTYGYRAPVAAGTRGFIHRELWKQLCRWYICSTECLFSLLYSLYLCILQNADDDNFSNLITVGYCMYCCYVFTIIKHATHRELTQHAMLSEMACLTPFSDFNQSPRNMYQCQVCVLLQARVTLAIC